MFCTSYSEFWESAIRGISSITSVSVVVILLLVGMFSALIKLCGLSGGFVWIANAVGMKGGIFVAFTFLATCIVSTATGSSIGTMFIAFPIFYPAGIMLGANEMMMAGCIVSGAIFGDNLAPISDTTIASASTQQFKNGKPADIGGVVSSRIKYSLVAGLITIVIFAIFGGVGGTYEGGSIDAASNPVSLVMLIPVVLMLTVSTKQEISMKASSLVLRQERLSALQRDYLLRRRYFPTTRQTTPQSASWLTGSTIFYQPVRLSSPYSASWEF